MSVIPDQVPEQLIRLWDRLTRPSASITYSEDRRRARLLSGLLIIFIPIEVIIVASRLIVTHNPLATLVLGSVTFVALVCSYWISRTRYFWIGSSVTVSIGSLAGFAGAFADPTTTISILYLALASIAGVVLLPPRGAVSIIFVNVSGVLLLPLLIPEWTFETVIDELTFLMGTSILILIVLVNRQRDILRYERQSRELKALYEKDILYREVIENATDVVYTVGSDGRFEYFNGAIKNLLGYSQKELLGVYFTEIVVPAWRSRIEQFYLHQRKYRIARTRQEFPALTIDKQEIWVEQTVTLVEKPDGNVEFEGVARDIHQRKLAELELARRNRELEILNMVSTQVASSLKLADVLREITRLSCLAVDATSAYICDLDVEEDTGTVLSEYYGEAASDLERVSDLGMIYSLSQDWTHINRWLDKPVGSCVMHVSDSVLSPHENMMIQNYDAKTILYVPLVANNVTLGFLELWETRYERTFTDEEIQLIQSIAYQAAVFLANAHLHESLQGYAQTLEALNSELDAYSHTIAHDLKGPLATINMYVQLIDMRHTQDISAEVKKYLDRIRTSSQKMNEMITQILRLSTLRSITEEMTQIDMREAAQAAVDRFEIQIKDCNITVHIDPDLPPTLGHYIWMEEVFANLINNAIKYMGDKPMPCITVKGMRQKNMLRYEVQDTGIGIPSDKIPHLFEAFKRLHSTGIDGNGLGLSIVKRIITRMRGEVGVESTENEGSTFWFTLPAHEEK